MFLSLICFLLRYMAIKLRIFSSCDGACGGEVDQKRKGKFVFCFKFVWLLGWLYYQLIIFFFQFYLFLAVLGLCCCKSFSPVVVSGGYFSCSAQASHFRASRPAGFSSCSPWTLEQQLWCMGLVALQHVTSSPPRDWTRVSCLGRQILYHWATREAPNLSFWQVEFWVFFK